MTERQRDKKRTDTGRDTPQVTAKNTTREDRAFLEEHAGELSKTTVRYAKWIHTTDEHADKPGQSLATRSHEVIQRWAEERGGQPATVPGTRHDGRPGVLRFDFAGGAEEGDGRLVQIGWEDWFSSFDERQLVFLYQEQKADGNQSNFFRLDSPEREDG